MSSQILEMPVIERDVGIKISQDFAKEEYERQKLARINNEFRKREVSRDTLALARMFGYYDLEDPGIHREMANFLDEEGERKLLLVPRKHLKTTIATITYPIKRMLKNPNIRILVANAVWDMARSFLGAIRANLQKDEFLKTFGNWSGRFTNDLFVCSRRTEKNLKEPTIDTAGLERSITGSHYDLIILDDLVADTNVKTIEQIQLVIRWYKRILDVLENNGEILILGTRWEELDLYGYIIKNFSDMFKIMTRGAKEEGKILYPKKFNDKILERLLREEGSSQFYAQYFNQTISDEDKVFPAISEYEKLPEFTEDKKKINYSWSLTIDPATSIKKDSLFTALIVSAVDSSGDIWLEEVIQKKLKIKQRVDLYIKLMKQFKPRRVGIETVGFQESDEVYLLEELRKLRQDPLFKDYRYAIIELHPKNRTKDDRIQALQPKAEQGKIHIKKTAIHKDELQYQFQHFRPRAEGLVKDLLDATAYILDIIIEPKKRTSEETEKDYEERSRSPYKFGMAKGY